MSKTKTLVCNLILHHLKLNLLSRCLENKSIISKLTQKQISQPLGYPESTINR